MALICDRDNYRDVFWLVLLTPFFFYGVIFTVMGLGSGYLQDSYGFTSTTAGFLLATPQIVLIIILPLVGKIVDRFGCISTFCTLLLNVVVTTGGLLVSGLAYLLFIPGCTKCFRALPGMLMIGASMSLYAPTIWSSLA